jgi:hypothetical protein
MKYNGEIQDGFYRGLGILQDNNDNIYKGVFNSGCNFILFVGTLNEKDKIDFKSFTSPIICYNGIGTFNNYKGKWKNGKFKPNSFVDKISYYYNK